MQTYVREADQGFQEPAPAGGGEPVPSADEDADRERLRFLTEVSEAMITDYQVESEDQIAEGVGIVRQPLSADGSSEPPHPDASQATT